MLMEQETTKNSYVLNEDEKFGTVKIADDVVAMIAALAATEVDGVAAMAGNMTNELLQKNADMLKMGTIETAKEAEKSVVSVETLQHTNRQLISTLDEMMKIQTEGAQKRKEAEAELGAEAVMEILKQEVEAVPETAEQVQEVPEQGVEQVREAAEREPEAA